MLLLLRDMDHRVDMTGFRKIQPVCHHAYPIKNLERTEKSEAQFLIASGSHRGLKYMVEASNILVPPT
jgi:hypothetical protein